MAPFNECFHDFAQLWHVDQKFSFHDMDTDASRSETSLVNHYANKEAITGKR